MLRVCAVDYVTDMHTGLCMEFRGEHAYTQARGRMVAGMYFDPANPLACVRQDASGRMRLAMQNEKGGLCVGVHPRGRCGRSWWTGQRTWR